MHREISVISYRSFNWQDFQPELLARPCLAKLTSSMAVIESPHPCCSKLSFQPRYTAAEYGGIHSDPPRLPPRDILSQEPVWCWVRIISRFQHFNLSRLRDDKIHIWISQRSSLSVHTHNLLYSKLNALRCTFLNNMLSYWQHGTTCLSDINHSFIWNCSVKDCRSP